MKATGLFVLIMALCLLVIPMIALEVKDGQTPDAEAQLHNPAMPAPDFKEADVSEDNVDVYEPEEDAPEEDREAYEAETDIPVSKTGAVTSFLVLDEGSGQVTEVSLRDFVRGAVAAEMPASFHSEALKAQAVAAHTFALHSRMAQLQSPDPKLKGADFSADPKGMKVYITEDIAKGFYGDEADLYWNKICEAADSVTDYVLEYEDTPIVAAYHAISSGMTEDASNIWSGSAPYLQAVQSEGDLLAPGYESTVRLTYAEVKEMLEAAYPDIELAADKSAWFGEPERSDSGYITEIMVGDKPLHGKEVRQVFGLRSHDFEINTSDDGFVFTVTGYGHGVGLSQYGADFLARQGKGFDEILSLYYTGATLKAMQ